MSESIYDVNGDVTYVHLEMLRLCKGLWNNVVALHTGILLYQLLRKKYSLMIIYQQLMTPLWVGVHALRKAASCCLRQKE